MATVAVVSTSSLAALSYSIWWQRRESSTGSLLVSRIRSHESGLGTSTTLTCAGTPGGPASLPGVLTIPSLSVVAPVESGLAQKTLAVAVGHDSATSPPGPGTTSVLAAHDVGYFSHLNALAIGALMYYRSRCASYRYRVVSKDVTSPGTQLSTPTSGALVLSTCWPLNALFWTTKRYVVVGAYVGSSAHLPAKGSIGLEQTSINLPAPASLKAAGLTLSSYSQEMGTLSLAAATPSRWAASPAPLKVTGVVESAWIGLHRAVSRQDPSWWAALAPTLQLPATLPARSGPLQIEVSAPWGSAGPITALASDNTLAIRLLISKGVAVVTSVNSVGKAPSA